MTDVGQLALAQTSNAMFNGTLSNDLLMYHTNSNNHVYVGVVSSSNYLVVGMSNISVVGEFVGSNLSCSNLKVGGVSITGIVGVSSNQSFSNVYSSNVYGSNVEVNGPMKVTGVITASGGLVGNASSATTSASCSGNAASATTALACTGTSALAIDSSNLVGTPNIIVGTVQATSITSIGKLINIGALSNFGTFSNSGPIVCGSFVTALGFNGNATSATIAASSTIATSASNLVSSPSILVTSATTSNLYSSNIFSSYLNISNLIVTGQCTFPFASISSNAIIGGVGGVSSNQAFNNATFSNITVKGTSFDGNYFYYTGASFGIINNTTSMGVYMTNQMTSWSALSDERLKNIIGPIEGALGKISELRTVYYNFKSDPGKTSKVGVIAQDVEKVFPEVVSSRDDGKMGVAYSELVTLALAGINELRLELHELRTGLNNMSIIVSSNQ